METGFIRAEVAKYAELIVAGGLAKLRDLASCTLKEKNILSRMGTLYSFFSRHKTLS